MSRRRHSRSIRERATALVSSTCSRRRSAAAGTTGAIQCCLSVHQLSQEPTAARLRFQVAAAAEPHSAPSAVSISSSASGRAERGGDPVEHSGVGALRVGVAADLRRVQERIDCLPHRRAPAARGPRPRVGAGGRESRSVTVALAVDAASVMTTPVPIDLPDNVHESCSAGDLAARGCDLH